MRKALPPGIFRGGVVANEKSPAAEYFQTNGLFANGKNPALSIFTLIGSLKTLSIFTLIGSLLTGKALACARPRGPLLGRPFAASESWHWQWSRLARPPSVQPVTGPARYFTSVSESS